ncbi:hypothetical protein SprV_0301314900 [Sparganum proliferum]
MHLPRCYILMVLLLLLGVLESKAVSKKDTKRVDSLVGESSLLLNPPPGCKDYLEHFLKWHISVSGGGGGGDISWILHLNGTAACQKCYSTKGGLFEDLEACMECHKPYAAKLKHSSYCLRCLDVLKPDRSACHLCFLDVKHKVQTTICRVESKVKTAIEKMRMKFHQWF